MKPLVYLESSVISYLISRPNHDVIITGRQMVTQKWWKHQRHKFELCISILVEEEVSRGDIAAAEKRLTIIKNISRLLITDAAIMIADLLILNGAIPKGSEEDALHIGIASAQGVDFLLTWNFKHINNAITKANVMEIVQFCGYVPPQLCSPEELGNSYDE